MVPSRVRWVKSLQMVRRHIPSEPGYGDELLEVVRLALVSGGQVVKSAPVLVGGLVSRPGCQVGAYVSWRVGVQARLPGRRLCLLADRCLG